MKRTLFIAVAITATLLTGALINSCTKDSSTTPSSNTTDPCSGIYCQNGGTCSGGTCICPTGWTGTLCQTPTAPQTGRIEFVNNSSNPYAVYIGGILQTTLSGNHYIFFTENVGSYTCEVIQQSGYLVSATTETFTANVTSGGTQVVSFP